MILLNIVKSLKGAKNIIPENDDFEKNTSTQFKSECQCYTNMGVGTKVLWISRY